MTNYVIIEHCNGELESIIEKPLSEEELENYCKGDYIVIEGKIIWDE